MRSGSSTTAAATTGPASGPRPASSQPATGHTPRLMAPRSRRNVGRSTIGSLSGNLGADFAVAEGRLMSAVNAPRCGQPNARMAKVELRGKMTLVRQIILARAKFGEQLQFLTFR